MRDFDFTTLDGRILKAFLTVLDEGSVSKAAERLGVTQSAVSHLLDKLRLVLGDPLFVRAGRGITPTERALALRAPVQQVLDGLKALTDARPFDPLVGQMEFSIAANDFQRDLIFPALIKQLQAEGVDARFRFMSSGIPSAEVLRQARCQLLITPFPPEGADIYQLRLFDDQLACFYDGTVRDAPDTPEAFAAAEYIEVRFDDHESGSQLLLQGDTPEIGPPRISVPNFSALPGFLKGSAMICALPSLMARVNLQGLACTPLPFATPGLTMYLCWHRRDHLDPAHQWLRQRIQGSFREQGLRS
ncbi:LysR family transcriptional regulator [Pseudomaricurvus sp. HS19]|uniref:LysR family transcriptional regulator n=1 Tax=Pseudomaricurvus sp. HS19 TaxID=2692626 RepID=UPI00136DBE89|nr:LysR family transcriptional regulator [Pseudomaricurvus sp. HS19]MYM62347.1 LysR family transcriptional regulator [Pseudomaricurvus sp. HS19]